MTKKLYQAMLITYVLAESKEEAKIIADQSEDDWTQWMIFEIEDTDSLPQKWRDSIPHGEEMDRTCYQILGKTEELEDDVHWLEMEGG